jgi:hypothetical protein
MWQRRSPSVILKGARSSDRFFNRIDLEWSVPSARIGCMNKKLWGKNCAIGGSIILTKGLATPGYESAPRRGANAMPARWSKWDDAAGAFQRDVAPYCKIFRRRNPGGVRPLAAIGCALEFGGRASRPHDGGPRNSSALFGSPIGARSCAILAVRFVLQFSDDDRGRAASMTQSGGHANLAFGFGLQIPIAFSRVFPRIES